MTKYIFTLFTALLLLATSFTYAQTKSIKLAGPAAVVSYPLMVMAEQQALAKYSIELSFVRWKTPDQLRAMVMGKQIDFSAMPSNLAAIFYNKGHHLTLMNISIWNIMDIISQDKSVTSFNDLIGEEIIAPFKNDMPSIILQLLLTEQLGDKSNQIHIRHSHNIADAAQLLLANKVRHALLIEPLSSIVLYQNSKAAKSPLSRTLFRTINISEQWRKTFPESPKLPQAGIIANTTVNTDRPLLEHVNTAYKESALWCSRHTSSCADIVKKHLPNMPKPALISAIVHTQVNSINSSKIKQELQDFYQILADSEPKRIGGKLPGNGFYF